MEPVVIEVRVRNVLGLPLAVDPRLNPEFGNITFYIRRPSGRIIQYAPIMCKSAPSEPKVLAPARITADGTDRHSASVFLSYGKYGYYFDEPGEYLVRALYQGPGDVVIPSNPFTLRVGRPGSREEDRQGADFFTYEVGMALYLYGSRSSRLARGVDVLQDVVEQSPRGSMRAVRIRAALANSLAKPFMGLEAGPEGTRVVERPAEPAASLATVAPAVETLKAQGDATSNQLLNHLVRRQAALEAQLEGVAEAVRSLATARGVLQQRGVNSVVLDDITAYQHRLESSR
jgi:hypothetical protein